MGDRNLTLFELHFDGPLRIGPSFGSDPEPEMDEGSSDASARSRSTDATGSGDEHAAGDEESGGVPVKGAIVGLLAIVLLAAAARVLMRGDDEDEPEIVELDESAVDADD